MRIVSKGNNKTIDASEVSENMVVIAHKSHAQCAPVRLQKTGEKGTYRWVHLHVLDFESSDTFGCGNIRTAIDHIQYLGYDVYVFTNDEIIKIANNNL